VIFLSLKNAVIDSLLNHRSVRRFKDKVIEPEVLEMLLKSGLRAASAGNLQSYSLIVVDDREKKEELSRACGGHQDFIADAAVNIAAVVDQFRFKKWVELNKGHFHADYAITLFIGFWDAIIALHNIVVAAESIGLGTCYVGNFLSVDIQSLFGTPDYVAPAGLVSIGYPDEEPELRPRLPLEAVVHRNSYRVYSDEEIRSLYRVMDDRWKSFSEEGRKRFVESGVLNVAQYVTLMHYTEEFIRSESEKLLQNIKKAKFKL